MTTDTYVDLGTIPTTAIDREVSSLEKLIEQAKSYAPEQSIAVEMRAANVLPEDARFHIGVGPGSLNGYLIHADYQKLEDVKPAVLWLAQRLGKFAISDYPEIGRRTYDFGRLKLNCFFNAYDDKAVCKFVQVGVEEKPVYKLMCGEEEAVQS